MLEPLLAADEPPMLPLLLELGELPMLPLLEAEPLLSVPIRRTW